MKEHTAAIHTQVPVDVATYLLNEKRSEIFKIETRLKVNLLLIPNPNLETPNYLVERLRHDAPQLDAQTPSYEMVTVPAEEPVGLPTHAPEVRPARPEPLVKGITPAHPAPMAAEWSESAPIRPIAQAPAARPASASADEKGLLDRFFGWLRKPAQPQPATASVAMPVPTPVLEERGARDGQRGRDGSRRDRDEGRRDRGRGGERSRGRQEGREERAPRDQRPREEARGGRQEGRDQPQQRQEKRPEQQQQRREGRGDQRREDGPRREPQQGQRAPRPAAEHAAPEVEAQPKLESQPVLEASVPRTDEGEADGHGRRRRRGRGRGGERGGERGERADRGDRGERAERPAREARIEPASPAEAIERNAAELESARAPQAAAAPHFPPQEASAPAPIARAQPFEQVVFREVSEHGGGEPDEAHRPQRQRRREHAEGTPEAPPLELVETRFDAPSAASPNDDGLPRRTKPRRRRGGSTAQEPLMLVETKDSPQPPDTPGSP